MEEEEREKEFSGGFEIPLGVLDKLGLKFKFRSKKRNLSFSCLIKPNEIMVKYIEEERIFVVIRNTGNATKIIITDTKGNIIGMNEV